MNKKVCDYIRTYSNKESIVLDAGCGTGGYTCFAAELNKKVYCTDIIYLNINSQRCDFVQSSIELLPFKPDYFDFIFCLSVLELVEHDRIPLEEFYRVLKPGGILLVTIPTINSPFHLIRKLEILTGVYHLPLFNVKYFHYYSRNRIKNMISNGYRLLEITTYEYNFIPRYLSFLYRFTNKLLFNKLPSISRLRAIFRKETEENNQKAGGYAAQNRHRVSTRKNKLVFYFTEKSSFLGYHHIVVLQKK
jgi:ubiquinone/menaquinone biosynthesis C-methylase UbiE